VNSNVVSNEASSKTWIHTMVANVQKLVRNFKNLHCPLSPYSLWAAITCTASRPGREWPLRGQLHTVRFLRVNTFQTRVMMSRVPSQSNLKRGKSSFCPHHDHNPTTSRPDPTHTRPHSTTSRNEQKQSKQTMANQKTNAPRCGLYRGEFVLGLSSNYFLDHIS
jgi:hypothetical protein